MPQRLIYNPKSWVFTKDANGTIYELTDYVVGGRVDRLVDQVSTAEVKLRNPDKVFTNPAKGVAFHPMDPITIFLERINGYPVRVFTGFLDETPYYQMYPGVITLKASCTLKRLLYTFFDPALPYFLSFMEKYGWISAGNGTAINPAAVHLEKLGTDPAKNLVTFGANPGENAEKTSGNDTSLGKLLWALLFYVAQIKDENIYIEAIPGDIASLVSRLFKHFTRGEELASKELEYFLQQLIGTSSQGNGGTTGSASSGNVKGIKDIVSWVRRVQKNYSSVPLEMILAVMYVETNMNNEDSTGNLAHTGWFQAQNKESGGSPPYAYGPWSHTVPTVAETHDLGTALNAFCAAAQGVGNANSSLKVYPYLDWAMATQGVTGSNNPRYPQTWSEFIAKAKQNLSEFPDSLVTGTQTGDAFGPSPGQPVEETQKGTTAPGKGTSGGQTRIEAMIREAATISNQNYFYAWGGGHSSAGTPSAGTESSSGGPTHVGFDCSGSVAAVLVAGGFLKAGSTVGASSEFGTFASKGEPGPAPSGTVPEVTIYYNSTHAWTTINNQYFSTGYNKNPNGGAGWGEKNGKGWPDASQFQSFHFTSKTLEEPYNTPAPPLSGGPGGGPGETNVTDPLVAAKAAAFTSEIAFPSLEEMVESQLLTGQKALMNDVPLMPFIQQVCQASMRSFMSLPNGDFYAFYPDYFGEMGHHPAYWYIHDIEILDGGINLSDKNLMTHVFAVGDNTWPLNEKLINELQSTGTVNIFNAFTGETVDRTKSNIKASKIKTMPKPFGPREGSSMEAVMSVEDAKKFLERYGARPVVLEFPMIRSSLYEMLLAYQGFCLAWSRQFLTPFQFTFMPELFPGGKVGFPDHGIQMYIESVTHIWDLEVGYTTEAKLSAPSLLTTNSSALNNQLPPNMVNALVEPIKGQTKVSDAKGQRTLNAG